MLVSLLWVVLGIALLYLGAEALVSGASSLAQKLGLSRLVIGLTIVAFGTSTPELVVSVDAALNDSGAIAVGNVVGSNICNVALILGLAALVRPLTAESQLLRVDIPVLVVVALASVLVLADNTVSRYEGVPMVLALVAYTLFVLRLARNNPEPQLERAGPPASVTRTGDIGLILGGLGLLVAGSRLLVVGAVDASIALGVTEAVVGLTIVALGTSLPELATSVLAARRGESSIAIGNVVGSNIFNLLGILGLAAVVRPLHDAAMSAVDLGTMVFTALVLVPLFVLRRTIGRAGGVALLAGYAAYVAWLVGQTV